MESINDISQTDGERKNRRGRTASKRIIASTSVTGGRYAPLNRPDLDKIHQAALDILQNVGISSASDLVIKVVMDGGGYVAQDGRLIFPRSLVEDAILGLGKTVLLAGQALEHDLHVGGKRVYVGSGGAAPMMIDLETDKYRPSTLKDLYNAARIVEASENKHFFARSVVARDLPAANDLAINTAFASLSGTKKHVIVAATSKYEVREIASMCYILAGSEQSFRERPFLSMTINHAVPPLRFSEEASEVLAESVLCGIPVHINTFGQMGASSPVTIAGCVAQTTAETLAGLVFAWLLDPKVKAIMGMRPMITDLRTGGMAGGAGEQALLTAVSVQMSQYYNLPNSTIAGATDSKISDAQSGYEKCMSVSLAAQTGCNVINQACGMQAGLMGCSLESYIIDNEMLGAILRSLIPVEVSNATLSTKEIGDVARGEGHFLGQIDTLARMQTDFLYPQIADRRTYGEWEAAGSLEIRLAAKKRARELLETHFPNHISSEIHTILRNKFDIKLPIESMRKI